MTLNGEIFLSVIFLILAALSAFSDPTASRRVAIDETFVSADAGTSVPMNVR